MPDVAFSDLCGFTPKQWAATDAADAHRFPLFGGARGPGKSYWLRWTPIRYLLLYGAQGIRGAHWGLFCETYPELQDRHISKIAAEFPPWLGELRDSKRAGLGYYLREEYGGGVLQLRNLDDPDKYKSAEFAGLSIDEITRTQKQKFDILRGSLRWPGVDKPRMLCATNPDGKHAGWVRQIWIERDFTGEGFAELQPVADDFVFIPALPTDNPHLSEQYWQDLRTAPRHLREAWLEGSWYVKSEGIVYDDFGEDNLTDEPPNMASTIELAFDDGYTDPRVVLFIQRTGTQVLVFDELYETKTLDDVSVRRVLDRLAGWCGKALPSDGELQRAYDNMGGAHPLERAARWCRENGVRLAEIAIGGTESVQLMRRFRLADIPARGGTHEIVQGIALVRRLIRDGQDYRTLRVSRRCKNLVRELTQDYRYPDGGRKRDAELPEDKNNHAADALRYWCWMRAR